MRDLLLSASVLACPIAMGLMMWFMGKGMRGNRTPKRATTDVSLADLRSERGRLGAELDRADTATRPA